MSRSRFACVADVGTELEVHMPTNFVTGDVRITIGGVNEDGEIDKGRQVSLDSVGVGGLLGLLTAYNMHRTAILASLSGAVSTRALERKAKEMRAKERKAKGRR